MPSKNNKSRPADPQEREFGPSWYDVWIMLSELQALDVGKITLQLELSHNVKGTAGLCFRVYHDGAFVFYSGKHFLDKGPDSAKTAAGAAWVALTKAYHQLEGKKEKSAPRVEELDITEAKQGDLFSPDGMGD